MMAPFYELGRFGEGTSLVIAVLLGIAFGWFLERGGMGSATKLAGQFYFTDLSVLKLMFSAILTAMLGLFWLSWAGLLDLSRVYVPETFIAPQLLGGLVFGAGSRPADCVRAPPAWRLPPDGRTAWRSSRACSPASSCSVRRSGYWQFCRQHASRRVDASSGARLRTARSSASWWHWR